MRRALAVLALTSALGGIAVTTDVLGSPSSTTGQTISFENVDVGNVYYVYSDDGEGPFAIAAFDAIGPTSPVIQAQAKGGNHLLTAPTTTCDCSRLEIDLTACDAGYVQLQSFRLVGTTQPTKIIYEDAGGNSWPSVNGQIIPATGASGYTTVTPTGTYGQVVSRLLVYFECGGAVDDIHFTCPDNPCPPPPPPTADADDWFTGGGFIFDTPSGVKATYGVGGGFKNGALWGHLNYIDHGTGMHFHGTSVTAYSINTSTANARHVEGTCTLGGTPGYTYVLDVADNGEPGINDKLKLSVYLGPTLVYASDAFSGTRTVDGGNIQLHKANTSTKGGKKSAKKHQ